MLGQRHRRGTLFRCDLIRVALFTDVNHAQLSSMQFHTLDGRANIFNFVTGCKTELPHNNHVGCIPCTNSNGAWNAPYDIALLMEK